MHRIARSILAALACATLASCRPNPPTTAARFRPDGPLVAVDLSDARATPIEDPKLASARNETVGLGVRLRVPFKDRARKKLSLRVAAWKPADGGVLIPAREVTTYQVVPMPAQTNRAEYVRHTGQLTAQASLPGALIPLGADKAGAIPLTQVRDAGALDHPGDKDRGIGEPLTLWFDVHVPAET